MVESTDQDWYCMVGGSSSGPFSLTELKFVVERGQVGSDTLVRQGKSGKWIAAGAVKGLIDQPSRPRQPKRMAHAPSTPKATSKPVETGSGAVAPASQVANKASVPPPVSPEASNASSKQTRVAIGVVAGAAVAAIVVVLLILLLRRDRSLHPALPQATASRGPVAQQPVDPQPPVPTPDAQEEPQQQPDTPAADEAAPEVADTQVGGGGNDFEDGEMEASTEDAPQESAASTPAGTRPQVSLGAAASEEEEQDEPQAASSGRFSKVTNRTARRSRTSRKGRMFGQRSAKNRASAVRRQGGSKLSEKAVELGLEWLAKHQSEDGRWSLHNFHTAGDCMGQCNSTGRNSDTAATGLALLPFLGAGYTQRRGEYKRTVESGLLWLVTDQLENGSFRNSASGNMYAHGQATIALCEALALTSDKRLREPAQLAIDYILKAQHSGGGWRYSPGSAGDTSVFGWQILALVSGRSAGLDIPKDALSAATAYLDSAQFGEYGSRYAYMPGQRSGSSAMTAEGLLCRIYLSWQKDNPGLLPGVQYLLSDLPNPRRLDMYYVYYATQVLHHYSGPEWDTWNEAMLEALVTTQETEGHQKGSWTPRAGRESPGGRICTTALVLCTLEVYYRHDKLFAD